jgi:hypothetical protein
VGYAVGKAVGLTVTMGYGEGSTVGIEEGSMYVDVDEGVLG